MVFPLDVEKIPSFHAPLVARPRLAQRLRFRATALRNIRMDFRPLSLRQPVRIKSSDLLFSDSLVFRDISYVDVGSKGNWKVEYENTLRVPVPFTYQQGLNGVLDEDSLRLEPKMTDSVSSFLEITGPKIVSAFAKAILAKRVIDTVNKSFSIGVLHYAEKPISEYPQPEGYNEDLTDMAGYEGLKNRLDTETAEKKSPDITVECVTEAGNGGLFKVIYYRPLDTEITFFTTYKITNLTSRNRDVDITGPTVGVIYDDRLRMTWVGSDRRRVTVTANSTQIYTFGQDVPPWMYGTILVVSIIGVPPIKGVPASGGIALPWSEHKVGTLIPP